jgi:hypothetical protein
MLDANNRRTFTEIDPISNIHVFNNTGSSENNGTPANNPPSISSNIRNSGTSTGIDTSASYDGDRAGHPAIFSYAQRHPRSADATTADATTPRPLRSDGILYRFWPDDGRSLGGADTIHNAAGNDGGPAAVSTVSGNLLRSSSHRTSARNSVGLPMSAVNNPEQQEPLGDLL